jgi:RimJ/RimL family protein N-acetyltransferase
MTSLYLRNATAADVEAFHAHQLDVTARHMAAFTSAEPMDRDGFLSHWERISEDEAIIKRTIVFDGLVAGHILCFEQFGNPAVSYWLGRQYWGKGIATNALRAFLPLVPERPLYARAAADNIGSLRVLEKCGFVILGHDTDFAPARRADVEETILVLQA